jgi:hypothetical protein
VLAEIDTAGERQRRGRRIGYQSANTFSRPLSRQSSALADLDRYRSVSRGGNVPTYWTFNTSTLMPVSLSHERRSH